MNTWYFLSEQLIFTDRAVLLFVVDNDGSSPGRKGFTMALSKTGDFVGTIGGGIMEVKLLELAKKMMKKKNPTAILKKQYHDKQHAHNQSGMICSGSQTVAIIPLTREDDDTLQQIMSNLLEGETTTLIIRQSGWEVSEELMPAHISVEEETTFECVVHIPALKRVHVFGGGHVGLALSEVLSMLDYIVYVYEERKDLNTLVENEWANEIRIVDFQEAKNIPDLLPNDTVLLVTHSYRTDKLLLQQLYDKSFSFIGMMGSEAKVEKLFEELESEGISREMLKHVRAPIGLNIFSKTAMEIAMSIAAELILHNNKELPTGRTQQSKT